MWPEFQFGVLTNCYVLCILSDLFDFVYFLLFDVIVIGPYGIDSQTQKIWDIWEFWEGINTFRPIPPFLCPRAPLGYAQRSAVGQPFDFRLKEK